MFSDEMSYSATVAKLLSICVSVNSSFEHLFHFLQTSLFIKLISLSFEPWIFCVTFHLFFEFLIFVYFPMLLMLVTINKVKHMTLHGLHASQIASSKTLVTQTLFCVANEIGPILVSRFLGNNSWKKLLAVRPKKRAERKRVKKKKNRTAIAKLFAHKLNKDSNKIFKVF